MPGYDDRVTDAIPPLPTSTSAPGTPDETGPTPEETGPQPPSPGERRLNHPPSDRYRAAEARSVRVEAPDPGASVARGVAISTVAAILGAVAIVLLGGILAVSAGLIVIAGAMGWGVATALRYGAGEHIASRRRVVGAVGLSVVAVGLAQLGLWQYARTEGGVLAPIEFLSEVYGPLVPLELGVAVALAWLAGR